MSIGKSASRLLFAISKLWWYYRPHFRYPDF